jgi:hypothetical protein
LSIFHLGLILWTKSKAEKKQEVEDDHYERMSDDKGKSGKKISDKYDEGGQTEDIVDKTEEDANSDDSEKENERMRKKIIMKLSLKCFAHNLDIFTDLWYVCTM